MGYDLIVRIRDAYTGLGVPGAEVYLFRGIEKANPQPPENVDLIGRTGLDGMVTFADLEADWWAIGLKNGGYETVDPGHTVPEAWRGVWGAWGGRNLIRDHLYTINVIVRLWTLLGFLPLFVSLSIIAYTEISKVWW